MPGACASPLDKFDAIQMYFASRIGGESALFEELDNEKILLPVVGGTLPCHGTFSKFWELMGSLRNTR